MNLSWALVGAAFLSLLCVYAGLITKKRKYLEWVLLRVAFAFAVAAAVLDEVR